MVDAVVIAGDSWSTGSVQPTEALFAAEGLSIAVTYEETAVAGSTAAEWVANQDSKLDKLDAALDGTSWARPEADILLLYLGGNDLNFALNEGLPGPTPALDDGIHPSAAGWSTLLAWAWDQVLEQLVGDGTWAP